MLESLNVEERYPRDDNDRVSLVEDLVPVVLDDQLPDQVIYIDPLLNSELHKGLVQLLKENRDVFAWCYEDMLGIDPWIMSH